MTKTAKDIFEALAPPLSLVNWLDATIADKQKRGKPVPEEIIQWLGRWKDIRTDGPAVTDALSDLEWEQLSEKVF